MKTGGDSAVRRAVLLIVFKKRHLRGFAELAVVEVEQFAATHEVGAQEAEERGDIAQRVAGVEQGLEFRRGKAVAADAEAGGEFFHERRAAGPPLAVAEA